MKRGGFVVVLVLSFMFVLSLASAVKDISPSSARCDPQTQGYDTYSDYVKDFDVPFEVHVNDEFFSHMLNDMNVNRTKPWNVFDSISVLSKKKFIGCSNDISANPDAYANYTGYAEYVTVVVRAGNKNYTLRSCYNDRIGYESPTNDVRFTDIGNGINNLINPGILGNYFEYNYYAAFDINLFSSAAYEMVNYPSGSFCEFSQSKFDSIVEDITNGETFSVDFYAEYVPSDYYIDRGILPNRTLEVGPISVIIPGKFTNCIQSVNVFEDKNPIKIVVSPGRELSPYEIVSGNPYVFGSYVDGYPYKTNFHSVMDILGNTAPYNDLAYANKFANYIDLSNDIDFVKNDWNCANANAYGVIDKVYSPYGEELTDSETFHVKTLSGANDPDIKNKLVHGFSHIYANLNDESENGVSYFIPDKNLREIGKNKWAEWFYLFDQYSGPYGKIKTSYDSIMNMRSLSDNDPLLNGLSPILLNESRFNMLSCAIVLAKLEGKESWKDDEILKNCFIDYRGEMGHENVILPQKGWNEIPIVFPSGDKFVNGDWQNA